MKTATDAVEVIAQTRPDMLGEALAAGMAGREARVSAVVNHGRWVVSCPDCNSAQVAAPTDPRFRCAECGNVALEGLWRPVSFPPPKARAAIEVELMRRAAPAHRNWNPGETVADLAAELAAFTKQKGRP